MLHRHLAISRLHLVVGRRRINAQHLVSIRQFVVLSGRLSAAIVATIKIEHRDDLGGINTQMVGQLLQRIHLLGSHDIVGHTDKIVEQLQAHALVGIDSYLLAALDNVLSETIHAALLLHLEEAQENLIALAHGLLAKAPAQKLAHKFHLRVHHLAVGTDDVGGEDQEGEEKGVALLARIAVLTAASRIISAAASLALRSLRVGAFEGLVQQCANTKTQKSSQGAAPCEAYRATNPFEYAHIDSCKLRC